MTPSSTATFILYDLRPSKQIERKLVFDTVAASLGNAQTDIDLPFIGMGGFRFVDFQVAHKMVGISQFVSIEHDADIVPRCEFNKPFNNVIVHNQSVYEFLLAGGTKMKAVVWLDYESGITEDILSESQILTNSVEAGSFVFITCRGVPDRSLRSKGTKQLRQHFYDQVGSFALGFAQEAYSKEAFSRTTALLLRNMLIDGFKGRTDGVFQPYMRLTYTDSTPMVTVGGYFGEQDIGEGIVATIAQRFPFLQPVNADFVYDVGAFNLTDAERRLFDRAALSPDSGSEEMASLSTLGFAAGEVETYRQLMRYVPRYFEALL